MKNYLTISSVIVGSMAFASIMPALMSAMMFDAPGSEENPATNAMFYAMFSFPLVCLLSIPLAWLLYAGSYLRAAAVAIWLCVVNIIVFVIGIVCLEIFYDGKFNG